MRGDITLLAILTLTVHLRGPRTADEAEEREGRVREVWSGAESGGGGLVLSAMEEEAETVRGDYTGYALYCTACQSPFGCVLLAPTCLQSSVGRRP